MPTVLRRQRLSGLATLCALAGGVAAMLVLFPPEQYSFYPRCPVYATFGLLCPGCGGTRALAALLRGHLGDALRWNALVTIATLAGVPGAGLYAIAERCWPERVSCRRIERWQQPLASIVLMVAVLFTLWRNLR